MLTLTNYSVNSGLDKAFSSLSTTPNHHFKPVNNTHSNLYNVLYFEESLDIIRAHRVNAHARRNKSKRLSLSSYTIPILELIKFFKKGWWNRIISFAGSVDNPEFTVVIDFSQCFCKNCMNSVKKGN